MWNGLVPRVVRCSPATSDYHVETPPHWNKTDACQRLSCTSVHVHTGLHTTTSKVGSHTVQHAVLMMAVPRVGPAGSLHLATCEEVTISLHLFEVHHGTTQRTHLCIAA